MARIAGVDLPKNKRGEIGLTYIYGIGRRKRRDRAYLYLRYRSQLSQKDSHRLRYRLRHQGE